MLPRRLPLLLTTAGAALLLACAAAAAADGNGRIAYARGGAIYASELDGTGEKQLYAGQVGRPLWSPDGTKLAFQETLADSTSVPVVVDAYGSHPVRLADSGSYQPVCWAGATGVVAVGGQGTDLYLFDLAGHRIQQLTVGLGSKSLGPQSCAPDGSAVAYAEYGGYRSALFVVGTDGSTPRELDSAGGPNGPPAWSPDGTALAFRRYDGVYTVKTAGGAATRLTTTAGEGGVVWSPDGSTLAFSAYSQTACDRYGCGPEVRVIDSNGGREHVLTPISAYAPSWSPDGTKLAFTSRGEAYVVNGDGTCPTELKARVETSVAFWQPVPGGASSDPFPCADLSVDVQPSFLDTVFNQIFPYWLTVKNSGNEAAANATVDQPFAAGFEPVYANAAQGSCEIADVALHCELGRLEPGRTAYVYVGDRLRYDGRFTASLHVSSNEPDPFQDDNTDSITLRVWPCTILGTPGNDVLNGTREPDVVCGREGADHIRGRGGNDALYGGAGPDTIVGGPGHDLLSGGPGNDVLLARDDVRDTVECGKGFDVAVVDHLDRVARDCERVLRR